MQTMSYTEAADFIKVKEGTLRNWVAQKKVPFHKVGRKVVFFQEELEKWILSGASANIKE